MNIGHVLQCTTLSTHASLNCEVYWPKLPYSALGVCLPAVLWTEESATVWYFGTPKGFFLCRCGIAKAISYEAVSASSFHSNHVGLDWVFCWTINKKNTSFGDPISSYFYKRCSRTSAPTLWICDWTKFRSLTMEITNNNLVNELASDTKTK